MWVPARRGERHRGEHDDGQRTRTDDNRRSRSRQGRPEPDRANAEIPGQQHDQPDLQGPGGQIERPHGLEFPGLWPDRQADQPGNGPDCERAAVDDHGGDADPSIALDEVGDRPGDLEPGERGKGHAVGRVLREMVPDHGEMDRRGSQRQATRQRCGPSPERYR